MRAARFLLVEDVYKTVSGTMGELQDQGHCIDRAEAVDQAIEKLTHEKYDVLLLDWRLPKRIDEPQIYDNAGQDVVRWLKGRRGRNANSRIPVIVLTNQSYAVDLGCLPQLPNFRGVVSKLQVGQFEALVEQVLEEREAEEDPSKKG